MPNPIKALSVRQPWAWCIVTGRKPVENRDWPTRFRGKVLIHAGKTFDSDALEWLQLKGLIPAHMTKADFEMGGIVGEAEIVDCATEMDSPWFFGKYGFVMERAKQLPFRPLKGQLGFFSVPSEATE